MWLVLVNRLCSVEGKQKQTLMRALTGGVVRLKPDEDNSLNASLKGTETELCNALRRPSESELRDGIRHSVAPIFLAILTP